MSDGNGASADAGAVDGLPADLISKIRSSESAVGLDELHRMCGRGIRILLALKRVKDIDDGVRAILAVVHQKLCSGEVDKVSKIPVEVRAAINDYVGMAAPPALPRKQRGRVSRPLVSRLRNLPERDREAIIRFYALGQPVDRICADLDLTEAEFRNLKDKLRREVSGSSRKSVSSQRLGQLTRIAKAEAGAA